MRKDAEKRQFNAILKEQIEMDRMKRIIERKEDQIGQDLVHFGPEETNARIEYTVKSKLEKQKFMKDELDKQIDDISEMKNTL